MEPTVITCETACTVTVEHVITVPPFNLSLEEGGLIAAAIGLCWAVGLVIREIAAAIRGSSSTSSESE